MQVLNPWTRNPLPATSKDPATPTERTRDYTRNTDKPAQEEAGGLLSLSHRGAKRPIELLVVASDSEGMTLMMLFSRSTIPSHTCILFEIVSPKFRNTQSSNFVQICAHINI
jgi:hypothetical protein